MPCLTTDGVLAIDLLGLHQYDKLLDNIGAAVVEV